MLPNKVLKAQLEDSEKMKNLMKLKTKYEAQVSDVEEQIRQLELELSEARDQVAERGQQVHELQAQLQKREAELTSVFTKSEVD